MPGWPWGWWVEVGVQWGPQAPGAGVPADIRAAAARRVWDAARLRDAAGGLRGAAGEGWAGRAAEAAAATVEALRRELEVLAGQAEQDARIWEMYAGRVEAIAAAHSALERERAGLLMQVRAAQAEFPGALLRVTESARLNAQIASLTEQLARCDAQIPRLVESRHRADAAAIHGFGSPTSRGVLAGAGSAGYYAGGVAGLAEFTEVELLTLFALHPEVRERLLADAPAVAEVAAWWSSLTPQQHEALALGAPELIGTLGGIPVMVRIAANRLIAARELETTRQQHKELDERARKLAYPGTMVPPRAVGAPSASLTEELAALRRKEAYLRKAVNGQVQLYLYEPAHDRIVEMIGTLGPHTTHVVTYVPGTGSNQDSFYSDNVQDVAEWMRDKKQGIVTFVWHGAEFPGQTPDPFPGAGLLAANDAARPADTGKALAGFGAEIATDPRLAAAHRQAVAHSWGLAAVTASEAAGAHYENVISLAGAWMPPGWTPDPTTDYAHYTYRDFLTLAKSEGLRFGVIVGGGRTPEHHDAFTTPLGSPIPTDESPIAVLTRNHDLIASKHPDNLPVLKDVVKEFTR